VIRTVGQKVGPRLPPRVRNGANLLWQSGGYLRRFFAPWAASADGRPVVMAYDHQNAPPSFGDFLSFVLIGRLYAVHGRRVEVVFVDGPIRDNFAGLPEEAFLYKVNQYEEIVRAVQFQERLRFHRMSFGSFLLWLEEVGRAACYPSRRALQDREIVYGHTWNTLEHVLRRAPRRVLDQFLLEAEHVAEAIGVELPLAPYVTLAVRAASVSGAERDISAEETLRQIDLIRSHFPDDPIWIGSDAMGTEAIKSWGLDRPDIHYTQDFGSTYPASMALALGGRCFVQIRGGGLMIAPLYSRTPMFLAAEGANQTSWWSRSQEVERPFKPDEVHFPWAHPMTVWGSPDGDVEERLDRWLAGLIADAPAADRRGQAAKIVT
jgi:hypothetical protein